MKFEKNDRYFNIAAYVFLTWIAILVASYILLHLKEAYAVLWSILGTLYLLLEPLIIGLLIAYLLDPLVDFYEHRCQALSFSDLFHRSQAKNKQKSKKRWPMRTIPTLFAFLTFLLVVSLFILLININLKQVAGNFSLLGLRENLAGYVRYFDEMMGEVSKLTISFGFSETGSLLEPIYQKINLYVIGFYKEFMESLTTWGLHLMNWLLAFVIAFYLLQDSRRVWQATKGLARKLLGQRYHDISDLGKKIKTTFAGYIRGELLDSLIIIILTSGALTLIQLDFALIIGIISGIFNLIPYFGPIVGFVLAVLIGLLDPNPMKALYGAIAILIIQQIDGWFIVPKLVGDCVKLHPLIVLLVIVIGGNLFGLIGMLLAVPITAVMRILLIYFFPDYFEEGA